MEGNPPQPPHRKKPPWAATVAAQAAICLALYAALSFASTASGGGAPRDLYFLSVVGGPRPADEQTHLLRKMDGLARAHRVEFVVNLSEFGEKDPLLGNATLYFPSLRMPWYTTGVSRGGSGAAYFKDRIAFRQGHTLDIIGVDTGLWQVLRNRLPPALVEAFVNDLGLDIETMSCIKFEVFRSRTDFLKLPAFVYFKDVTDAEQMIESKSKQYRWLMRTLAVTNGTWRLVVGFHGLKNCMEGDVVGMTKQHNQLHLAFVKHRVNAYLSAKGCTTESDGVSYIGNLGVADEHFRDYVADGQTNGEMRNGFVIHRISPLEIESYFVTAAGEAISQHTMRQSRNQYM